MKLKRRILEDFQRGLTIVGLARKYAKTKRQIEDVLRGFL